MSDKKHNLSDDLIYSKEVVEFITVSNEFCLLVEGLNSLTREQFIEQSYKLLTLIHLKALFLPKPEIKSLSETESFVNEADWHFIDTGISTKLGSLEVFSDLIEPADPYNTIEISLSECLADTYQDLKDFSQLYQFANLEAITQGLFDCKVNFEQIWGPRIIIVIKEFHNMIYGDIDLSDEKPSDKQTEKGGNSFTDELFGN